jgi:hypothetical protein
MIQHLEANSQPPLQIEGTMMSTNVVDSRRLVMILVSIYISCYDHKKRLKEPKNNSWSG